MDELPLQLPSVQHSESRLKPQHSQCFSESQSQNGEKPSKQETKVQLAMTRRHWEEASILSGTLQQVCWLAHRTRHAISECYSKFEEAVSGVTENLLGRKLPNSEWTTNTGLHSSKMPTDFPWMSPKDGPIWPCTPICMYITIHLTELDSLGERT